MTGGKPDFDWNLMRSFLAVLDAGSFSAAARRSSIPQPTLTRHVAVLENSLETTLFERGREGARPTASALAIAIQARAMADSAGAIALAAAGASETIAGTVRITASEVVSSYMLPSMLRDLLTLLPGLAVELVPSNDVQNLLRRDADIAIRMVEPTQLELVSRKLGTMEIGVWAHRDYLARVGTPQTIGEMAGHLVIGYDRSDLVLRGFRALGVEVGRDFFRFRTDGQVAAHEALLAGVGIGFAPVWLGSRSPELVRIARQYSIPPLNVWLVTHRELRTSARIRAVYDHLGEALVKLCD